MSRGRRQSQERPLQANEIDQWEVVKSETEGPLSAVLTVRFSPDELRRIRDVAKYADKSMAEVIRDAVDAYIQRRAVIRSMGWGWSTGGGDANVVAVAGLVTLGQGQTEPQPAS